MRASTALKLLPAVCGFLLAPASADHTYVGCAADDRNARLMEVGPIPEDTMSAEICEGICLLDLDSTYTHFGTQYSNECFCTSELGTMTESTACTKECANTPGEYCGGFDAISVYEIDYSTPAPTPAPVTVQPGSFTLSPGSGEGFEYIGCAEDGPSRIMSVGPTRADPMSAEICFGICQDLDTSFAFFGTQYSNECFCTIELETTESSACTMECANTDGEACGGSYAMSVYRFDSTSPTPAPVPVNDYTSIGCRTDDRNDRIMGNPVASSSDMTAEVCYGVCSEAGPFTHFGTQYSKECFCGVDPTAESINKHSDELSASEHCLMACAGDSEEMCGGFDEMNVYDVETGYTSLGCFPDPRDGSKAMEVQHTADEMSTEICYNICAEEDPSYVYFGTQYSVECWCSTTFSEPTADGVCDYPCAGNPSESCGGFDEISAYFIN